jgi:vancomycin resistance protein YoaR
MAKNKTNKKIIKSLAISVTILAIAILPIVFTYIYFTNRIYPNVYIAGTNIGGRTKKEATALLKPKTNIPESISLTYGNIVFDLPVNDLSVGFNEDKTINKALLLGRTGNITKDIKVVANSFAHKTSFPIEINVDENTLNSFIDNISQKINIDPENAKFTIENGKVTAFALEVNGLKVSKDKLKSQILAEIGKNNGGQITLPIPTEIAYADIKSSDLNNLGIKELVGTGTSRFAGSIGTRIFNINKAAESMNNTLIAPGETFSFDKIIGDISAANGYQQAYVIQNGATVLGDGGGVCQVSTTMFRAAMNTGLPITERHAHAYRVHYYEEDAPPGMDATIYSPTVDFKFKNDLGSYLLIQTDIDLKNLVLTFNFYGTKDGRTVEITKPTLWGYSPAPADLYTDDPTLPVGQVKQIDFAASGIKSQFEYTVSKDGQVINHQVFFSNFEPWQAKFLRGTKV